MIANLEAACMHVPVHCFNNTLPSLRGLLEEADQAPLLAKSCCRAELGSLDEQSPGTTPQQAA